MRTTTMTDRPEDSQDRIIVHGVTRIDVNETVEELTYRRRRRVALVGAVVIFMVAGIALLIGDSAPTTDQEESGLVPSPTATAASSTLPRSSTEPPTSTAPATTALPPATLLSPPQVSLLDDATALKAAVAIAEWPGERGGATVWVLHPGGSLVRRDDVPLRRGDFSHPILLTEDRLVFANGQHAFMLDSDLATAPVAVSEAGFVVPGATPDLIWVAGTGSSWVAPLDVATGVMGNRSEVEDLFWWPFAGVADGLLVGPLDEDAFGKIAYWSAESGLQQLEWDTSAQSDIAAAGNTAVLVSPGGAVQIVDVESGDHVSTVSLDLGGGRITEACLSPDQKFVAVVGSTGEGIIANARDGTVIYQFAPALLTNVIAWTALDQFIYLATTPDHTLLRALDMETGTIHDIASLQSPGWLTASGSMC